MINIVPHVSPLFIDTIAITLDIPGSLQVQVMDKCEALGENFGVYSKFSKSYSYSVRLMLDDQYGNPSPLVIQCGPTAKSKSKKIRFMRLEWHPSKVNAGVVKSILNTILPGGTKTLLGGCITRIDLATNLKYVRPEHLQWHYPSMQCSENFLKGGKIHGAYLGTPKSDKEIAIYDKNAQLKKKNQDLLIKYPIPSHDVTRVEMRLRMDLSFPVLMALKNPFESLSLAVSKKPKPSADDDMYRLFERVCIWEGVNQALMLITNKDKKKEFLSRVMAKEFCTFWNPALLWEGLPQALKAAGFPVNELPHAATCGG